MRKEILATSNHFSKNHGQIPNAIVDKFNVTVTVVDPSSAESKMDVDHVKVCSTLTDCGQKLGIILWPEGPLQKADSKNNVYIRALKSVSSHPKLYQAMFQINNSSIEENLEFTKKLVQTYKCENSNLTAAQKQYRDQLNQQLENKPAHVDHNGIQLVVINCNERSSAEQDSGKWNQIFFQEYATIPRELAENLEENTILILTCENAGEEQLKFSAFSKPGTGLAKATLLAPGTGFLGGGPDDGIGGMINLSFELGRKIFNAHMEQQPVSFSKLKEYSGSNDKQRIEQALEQVVQDSATEIIPVLNQTETSSASISAVFTGFPTVETITILAMAKAYNAAHGFHSPVEILLRPADDVTCEKDIFPHLESPAISSHFGLLGQKKMDGEIPSEIDEDNNFPAKIFSTP